MRKFFFFFIQNTFTTKYNIPKLTFRLNKNIDFGIKFGESVILHSCHGAIKSF